MVPGDGKDVTLQAELGDLRGHGQDRTGETGTGMVEDTGPAPGQFWPDTGTYTGSQQTLTPFTHPGTPTRTLAPAQRPPPPCTNPGTPTGTLTPTQGPLSPCPPSTLHPETLRHPAASPRPPPDHYTLRPLCLCAPRDPPRTPGSIQHSPPAKSKHTTRGPPETPAPTQGPLSPITLHPETLCHPAAAPPGPLPPGTPLPSCPLRPRDPSRDTPPPTQAHTQPSPRTPAPWDPPWHPEPSPRDPRSRPLAPPTMCRVSVPTTPPGRMPRGPCSKTAPSAVRVLCSHPPRRALASSSSTWGHGCHPGDTGDGGPGHPPRPGTRARLTLGGRGPRAKW